MFRLLDMEAEEVDMDDKQEREKAGEKNDRVPYAVSARQVTFAYEEEQPILKEVTVDIPSRSLVSVVGASGCGKSTLASLFMGVSDCAEWKGADLWQGYSDDPGKGAHETDDACIFPKLSV